MHEVVNQMSASRNKAQNKDKAKSGQSTALELVPIDRMVESAAQDIGSFIRAQREAAQVSLRQLAERTGVSNPYLSQIERGLRKPSAEVLAQIAKGLRVSAEVLYLRAGILEESRVNSVRDAVLTAPELTERQRQVLVEVYESFVANNARATGSDSTAQSAATGKARSKKPATSPETGTGD